MDKRNTDQLPLSRPQPGTWPTTQACALPPGALLPGLSLHGAMPNPVGHTSQGPVSSPTSDKGPHQV